MPTQRVIRRAHKALRALRLHQVAGLGTGWRSDTRTAFTFGERWIFGSNTQLDVNGSAGQKAQWMSGLSATGDAGLIAPRAVRLTMALIFGAQDVAGWLRSNNIDQSKQRLALLDDTVCIVIGSDSASTRVSQLWIDQETFLPMRMVCRDGSDLIDMRCIQWSGPISNGAFPHRLTVRLNGRTIRTFEVSTVRLRPKVSASL